MNLMGMLSQALGRNAISQMSRSIGADRESTSTAIAAALPLLVGALSKNAASRGGASSLLSALDRDHDGSILDDVGGFFSGAGSGDGDAILGHVLGGRRARGSVETGVSRASGIDPASVAKLMAILAPLVMGALGRVQRSQGLDASGLGSLLGAERQSVERNAPDAMATLSRLLDADGDGSALDDMTNLGTSLLGTFFKR
jgi:hypothetical protein